MIRKLKCALLTLLCWTMVLGLMQSQDLKFDKVNIEDGLSNGRNWSAKCILKDDFGLVWIATIDGLNRWDGYHVENFRHDPFDSLSISSNFITALAKSNGNVYIGTADNGIVRYNYQQSSFESLGLSNLIKGDTPQINHLTADKRGNIWIGTAFSGLWRYHIPKDTFIYVPMYADAISEAQNKGTVNSILRSNGELAIANHHGIHIYNPKTEKFSHYPIEDIESFTIEEDDHGAIWYSGRSWSGIKILDPETGTIKPLNGADKDPVFCIRNDGEGSIWYATYGDLNQLIQYHQATGTSVRYLHNPSNPNSYTASTAMEMTFDTSGHLWYMTASHGAGYASLDELYFEKLTDFPVDNILFSDSNTLLLPTGNEVFRLDLQSRNHTLYTSSRNKDFIRPSLLTKDGAFWYKNFQSGEVYMQDITTGVEMKLNINIGPSEAILDDGMGRIWTSNMLQYLEKSNPNKLIDVNTLLTIKSSPILLPQSIYYDLELLSDSEIAIASLSNGLFVYNFRDTVLTQYSGKDFTRGKLSSPSISHIHKGRHPNMVYIATGSNLNVWDRSKDTFTYINNSDGLLGKILSLYEDQNLNLWVLTSEGIHQIKDHQVVARFGDRYDLKGQVDRIDPTMVSDQQGLIYFSTSNSLFRFDPNRLDKVTSPNDILIDNMYLKRKKIDVSRSSILSTSIFYPQDISLEYADRNVGFGYVSPFGKDRELNYYYRLVGFDTTWINNGSDRQVHFTNLDNGTYTLELRGKSAEGQWTKHTTSIQFTIKAPWYKRWWAYLLFTALVFGSVYMVYQYRIRQILKYQTLRTKISADLHDDVGTLLTSLAMQSDILGMDAPPDKASRYERFSSLSREAMEKMRDTVWAIDSRKDNMVSLVDRMNDYLADVYTDQGVNVEFLNEVSKLSSFLAPDIRQNVYLIFKEAVNNAIKHSNGDKITVRLYQSANNLSLSIKDNGSLNSTKFSGLGMSNMKMRAMQIQANLRINTTDGYEIILTI